jgi:membrane-bound ClpP family serine protease
MRGSRAIGSELAAFAVAVLLACFAAVAQEAKPGTNENRVGKYVRIAAPLTDKTFERVRRTVETFVAQAKQRGEWPVLILEIEPGRTQFGDALDLAKYLTGPNLAGATTVAYVPETLTGHGVLIALACNELILHRDGLNETTEIGNAGEHETAIDATMTAGYRQIAESRRTVPVPIALKMLDKSLELVEVETEKSREFALSTDLAELKKTKAIGQPKTIVAAGTPGRFTAAKAKDLGFATTLAADREDLVRHLGLPRSVLQEDPSLDGEWRTVRVDISGPITGDAVDRTIRLIDRQIDETNANFICIWIDSPGGSPVDSLRMANYLAGFDPAKRRTVAYIAKKARGDAAAVALGCDQIVMQHGASLGGSGEAEIDEEDVPTVEATFRDVARRKHRSQALAAAMINPAVVPFRYTRVDNGIAEYFTEKEAAALPDAEKWKKGEAIKSADENLLLSGDRAEQLGVAHDVVTNFTEFKTLYGLDNDPQLVEPGWAQMLIDALNSPGISLMLLLIGGAALYAELHAPGIGVGAFIGAVCFVLYFWSAYLGGTAGWLEVLLFALGAICLLMEIFVFPGVGIFGLGGGLLVIASLVLASQTYVIPRNEYQMEHVRTSLLTIVGAAAGIFVVTAVMRRFLPHTPMFNRVLLAPPTGEELQRLIQRESLGRFEHLLNARGSAYTPLVPGGKARIGEELVDVVADGEFIDRGMPVEVVEVYGTRIVVRAVDRAV